MKNFFSQIRSKRVLSFLAVLLLIITVPLTVFFAQKQQEIRQRAAGTNALYVSTTGSDSNPGTQTAPFKSITHAATLATPGTTVHVGPGIYTESTINVSQSGSATAPITFVSDVPLGAKIADTSWHAWNITGSYITIQGFEMYMTNASTASDIVDVQGGANNVSIIGNYVHDVDIGSSAACLGGSAINSYSGTGLRIIGNRIAHAGPGTCNHMHGSYIGQTNAYVANNIISDVSGFGVTLWPEGSNTVIINNDISNARFGGIDVSADTGHTTDYVYVANNIVRGGNYGIHEYAGGTVGPHNTFTNNDLLEYVSGAYHLVDGATPQNTYSVDPQYVNWVSDGSGDYHLQSTSPMIDKGIATNAPSTDFDNNPRPQGAGFDIGAYEYVKALYVSPSGNDSNPCSQASPCATITHAATLATPGTTVHVAPGTYTQAVTTNVSGTATARIAYVSNTGWGAKISTNNQEIVWNNTGDYVDIVGFEITGTGSARGIYNNGSYVRSMNNFIHDIPTPGCTSGGGITDANYSGSDDDEIDNVILRVGTGSCKFTHGIYHANLRGHIYNNIVSNGSGYGIQLWHASNNVVIANNLVFKNQTGGIIVGAGDAPGGITDDYTTISNNIITNNYGNPALFEYGSTGIHNQYLNNLLYQNYGNNGDTPSLQNGVTAQATLTVNPQFINYQADGSGDYHLQSTSPAIDSGTSTGAPSTDFDNNPRPQGNGFDIGAYEYTTTGIPTNVPTPTSTPTPTPTPTPNPLATNISLIVCPHGLGNCGDNVNPNGGGNTNPLHPQRTVTVTVFNTSNQIVATGQGTVNFNTTNGNFTGLVSFTNLQSGSYLVVVRIDGYLSKQLPGIQTITTNQTITLPSISLVAGDINNDNQLDIIDYNMLISCFGSKANTTSCTNKTGADLDDNGVVDGADYNLFLREVSVQKGN